MQKWEYKRTAETSEKNLNKLGEQGWELVTVTHNSGMPSIAILKRPKNQPAS